VATGEALEEIRKSNSESFRNNMPTDVPETVIPAGGYTDRKRAIGKALLEAHGVERHDKEGRLAWTERGFRFFDAPAVIFILMDDVLDESTFRLEMGCVAQNICLAAFDMEPAQRCRRSCIRRKPVKF